MGGVTIGLDIAYNSLKVSGLARRGKRFQLIGMGTAATPADSWKAEELQNREEIAKVLKATLEHAKPSAVSGKKLMIALPELAVFSTTVTAPTLDKKELAQALPYEIAERLSLNVDEYYIDYEVSPSLCRPAGDNPVQTKAGEAKADAKVAAAKPDEKSGEAAAAQPKTKVIDGEPAAAVVFAAAAKKTLIQSLEELAELCGMELAGVDIKAGAIARAIVPDATSKVRLILDLGASSTGVNVVEGDSPRLISSVPLGTKVQPGEAAAQLESFKQHSAPIFDELVHVTKFFENRVCPEAKIEEILITGGGSNIVGIETLISQETGLPALIANPARLVDSPSYPIPKEIAVSFADSFGLAMREEAK